MIWHNIRWMNGLSIMLILIAGMLLCCGLAWKVMQRPEFDLRKIVIESELAEPLQHIHEADVRANITGRLRGNFFTVDLDRAKQAFLSIPWVRQASVHRVWPNALLVKIEEHIPAAIWKKANNLQLVNRQGEIFYVHPHDVQQWQNQQRLQKSLVYLSGPEDSAAEIMLRRAQIQSIFAPLNWQLVALDLSPRYAWHAQFDNGINVEFGRGENKPPLEVRAQQFVQALPKVMHMQSAKLVYADLRYPQGFAVRFQK